MSFVSLSEAFIIAKKLHNVKQIRVYAISSYMILSLFSSNNIKVEKCNVLIRAYAAAKLLEEDNQGTEREIIQMIGEWKTQKRRRNVKT